MTTAFAIRKSRAGAKETLKTFVEWMNRLRDEPRDAEENPLRAVMRRWPLVVAHVICESLGYATPSCAARIVDDAAHKRENWCEWIACCYQCDPRGAVRQAVATRTWHKGYMAEIQNAKRLVLMALLGHEPTFASWF
jgi:hypothetical protein